MRGRATLYLLISAVFLAMLGCTASAGVMVTPTVAPSPSATRLQIAAASPTATPVAPTRVPLPTSTSTPQATPSPTPTGTPFPPLPTVAPEFWASVGVSPDTLVAIRTGGEYPFGDIANVHVDGTHFRQITHYGYNLDPVLSPDRKRIAYRSVPLSITSSPSKDNLRGGYYNIWVITADGAQAWQLTNSEKRRSKPAWSPDSRKVAFVEDSAAVEIQVDNQARREVAQDAGILPYWPDAVTRYRPDGNGIGYTTTGGGLAWIDTAGTTHTLIPTTTLPMSATVAEFDWLPDGQHAVYVLARENVELAPEGFEYSVWIVRVDGSAPIKLTGRDPFGYGPRNVQASPDGRIISVIGSSYGDACSAGTHAAFLLLTPDLKSAQLVASQDFKGRPERVTDFYPISGVTWVSSRLALARFAVTCPEDEGDIGDVGTYLMDPVARRMVQIMH